MKKVCLILTGISLFLCCASQQQLAERREQMQKAVNEAVEKGRLRIDITSMSTMRYGTRTVTPDFFLELRGDTLQSYLPYMGQAYQAPMTSPSQGLNFEEPMLSYKLLARKPHLSRIEIKVRTQEDIFLYGIELYDTGQAYIQVRSQNRDPISFSGFFAE